ncbi:hypothetical protein M408DRAFT_78738, partial [Serendipita vermifera MAFF 305830]
MGRCRAGYGLPAPPPPPLPASVVESTAGKTRNQPAEPSSRSVDVHVETYPDAGFVYETDDPHISKESRKLRSMGGDEMYYPFANDIDFELAAWLHDSGLSRSKIDEFLKLKYVSVQARMPSFTSAAMLRDRIELLPDDGPRWKGQKVTAEYGDPTAPITLFYKDPIEVVAYLLSRPNLASHMKFAPAKVWETSSKKSRVYSDMFTSEWWWDVQSGLSLGSTVIPLLIGSDKTHLTDFTGDKKAWPVYLSLGNIDMKARRTRSLNAWAIIGYMPIVEWNNPKDIRGTLTSRLFHQCAKVIFQSIINLGEGGILLPDSKGDVRNCYPRLAAWLSDHPEQLMLNCAAGKTCPTTTAGPDDLGDATPSPPRTTGWILRRIERALLEAPPGNIAKYQAAARRCKLNGVHDPFWKYLPGYRADLCAAPDIFHGVIRFWRDHLFKWIARLVGTTELDARLKALQKIIGFRHFTRGISHLSQWTGREDKELQRVMVALIAGAPKVSPKAMRCIRTFHDFLYLVQYRSHSTETIGYIHDYLEEFHEDKNVFIEAGVRRGKGKTIIPHFKIPKLALFHTYEWHIPQLGPSTQFTTEITETHHQPLAKEPFRATNKSQYAGQMCRYLDRKARIRHARELYQW